MPFKDVENLVREVVNVEWGSESRSLQEFDHAEGVVGAVAITLDAREGAKFPKRFGIIVLDNMERGGGFGHLRLPGNGC